MPGARCDEARKAHPRQKRLGANGCMRRDRQLQLYRMKMVSTSSSFFVVPVERTSIGM
jgi:hypothetical protein